LLKELEPIKYEQEVFKKRRECAICLVEYNENSEIIILPCDPRYFWKRKINKRHNFHSECIREWLRNKNECPICRTEITRNALSKFSMQKMMSLLKEYSLNQSREEHKLEENHV